MSSARCAAIRGVAPETEAKLQMVDAGITPVMTAIKALLTSNDCPDLIAVKDILPARPEAGRSAGAQRPAAEPDGAGHLAEDEIPRARRAGGQERQTIPRTAA
jgi:hypothetical protein